MVSRDEVSRSSEYVKMLITYFFILRIVCYLSCTSDGREETVEKGSPICRYKSRVGRVILNSMLHNIRDSTLDRRRKQMDR